MAHIDLHLHLLPGVDDGAPDEAAALEHAARMVADGVREATVTPHVGSPDFLLDPLTVPERTARLQAAPDREGLALRLHAGGEIHPERAAELTARELDAVAHGPARARWVLAEVPFDGIDERFLDGLRAIRGRGFGVLIAHPERARHTLAAGTAPALASGASPAQVRRLTYDNPRLLLREGLRSAAPVPGRDWQLQGTLERARQARRRLAQIVA
jgi:protein-tyrosine phosphatase